jgi:hypothetical protein
LRERIGAQIYRRRWLWGGPGLAGSFCALILILALQHGLAVRMDQILNWTGARTISFVPWTQGDDPLNKAAYLTIDDYNAVRTTFPDWTVAWLGDTRKPVVEASANLPQLRQIKLQQGRWFTAEEEQSGAAVAVLGSHIAAELAPNGDMSAIKTWRGLPVVGILDEWELQVAGGLSPLQVYVPLNSGISPSTQDGGTWPDTAPLLPGQLIVEVPPQDDLGQAAVELKAFLAARHPEGVPQMILPAGVTEDVLARRNQIYLLAGLIAGLCMILGCIGLMNLTFIAVFSRMREIGVRRALGATKRHVMQSILGETVRLCIGAAFVGTAAGLIGAYVLQQRFGWPTVWPLYLIVVATIIAVLIGLLSGALPAWWAAALQPARVIRTE